MRLFVVILLSVLLTNLPHRAWACSGQDRLRDGTLFEGNSKVFRALVTKVEPPRKIHKTLQKSGWVLERVSYELKEVLKGKPTSNGPIFTGFNNRAGCGMSAIVGREYLFRVVYESEVSKWYGEPGGLIDIFTTKLLKQQPSRAEEIIAKARSYLSP